MLIELIIKNVINLHIWIDMRTSAGREPNGKKEILHTKVYLLFVEHKNFEIICSLEIYIVFVLLTLESTSKFQIS